MSAAEPSPAPSPPPPLTLEWLPGRYAVCRLEPDAPVPIWVSQAGATPRVAPAKAETPDNPQTHIKNPHTAAPLLSITRTDRELSIVIDQSLVPAEVARQAPGIRIERDFAALRVAGTLDFNLTGIIARLTAALAAVKVPVYVISTFETDVLMVKARDAARSQEELRTVARWMNEPMSMDHDVHPH